MKGDDRRVYTITRFHFHPFAGWVYTLSHLTEMDGHCIHGVPEENLKLELNQEPKDMSKAKTVCFGRALEALKMGQKVFRSGWNGKGMWLGFVTENEALTRTGESWIHAPWIGMKTTDGKFVPWLCSQTDMIACDWCIMSEEEEYGVADRIPVPENIKFHRWDVWSCEGNKGVLWGLCSPNKKLALFTRGNVPLIDSILNTYRATPYLVPCKRSDLKPGDIAFRARELVIEKSDIRNYSVILDDRKHAFWTHDMDMIVDTNDAFSWYKVIFE